MHHDSSISWRTLHTLALVAGPLLGLGSGCGSRGLRADTQGDGGPPDGALSDGALPDGVAPDATVPPGSCAPMDAMLPPNVRCGDPTPIGWTWTGTGCYGIPCACEGADCDRLYATEALCMADRAPACLPPPDCLGLDYQTCEDRPDCQVVFYGGGCIDLDTCEWGGPSDGNWLCWEQGIVCLPSGAPCSDRGPAECDGDCYWWEHRTEHCFSDMGEGECCFEEGYGYCAPLPREVPGCEAQAVQGCSDPCVNVVGYFWDGTFCAPIRCCCEGPYCNETYDTLEACLDSRAECLDNACAEAGGTCNYGDAVVPTCDPEYGTNYAITSSHPGVCGMGVCCTPCPNGPGVSYVSHDPAQCADIDFDCFDQGEHFDNECGCGCIAY